MSACSCYCDCDSVGSMLRGPHVARREVRSRDGKPYICPICKCMVESGQRCYDFAGLDDVGGGWFHRMHEVCYDLMIDFKREVCGHGQGADPNWSVPWPLHEGAQHAVAHGHEPYWRNWLLKYEQTWGFRSSEEG